MKHGLTIRPPESKQQSMQWIEGGSLTSKKRTTVPSTRKFMVTIFFLDQNIILLIHYLQKGNTIIGEYN